MVTHASITALEELSLNAWPSFQTLIYDGWVLRFAEGYTRRANSVNPIYPSSLPLEEKIEYCEQVYQASGQKTVFKLTGAHHPADLERALIARGYEDDCYTAVQILKLHPAPFTPTPDIQMESTLHHEWVETYCQLRGTHVEDKARLARIMQQIKATTGYFILHHDGEPVSMALGVVERGWLGIYDVVTAEAARGRRHADTLLRSLLAWAGTQGAKQAYLQVMLDNAPALRLYQRLGFQEAYRYWYRQK